MEAYTAGRHRACKPYLMQRWLHSDTIAGNGLLDLAYAGYVGGAGVHGVRVRAAAGAASNGEVLAPLVPGQERTSPINQKTAPH